MKKDPSHSPEITTRNLYVQGSFLVASQVIVRAINLLYRIPVTNLWGDRGLGIYSDAYQVYNFFLVFASLSIPASISKMVSERLALGRIHDARHVLANALKLMSLIGIISMLVMIFGGEFIAVRLFDDPEAARSIRCLGPTVLVCSLMSVFRGYFQGMNNMKPTSFSEILEGVLHAVFAVFLALAFYPSGLEKSVAGGILGTLIGALGSLVLLAVYYLRWKPREVDTEDPSLKDPEPSRHIYHQMISLMIPIIIGTLVYSVKSVFDIFVFGKLMIAQGYDPKDVVSMRGMYTGKYLVLINLPIAIGESMGSASIPSVSAYKARNDRKHLHEAYVSILRTVCLIAVPCSVGLAVLGKPILRFLFPASYLGGELLWVGSFSVLFYSIMYVTEGILNGLNKPEIGMQNSLVTIVLAEFVLVFCTSVLHLGVYSLVVSNMACGLINMILNLYRSMKLCRLKVDFGSVVAGPLVCSIMMGIACIVVYILFFAITGSNAAALILSILTGIFVFFFLAVNLNVITKKDAESLPGGHYLMRLKW